MTTKERVREEETFDIENLQLKKKVKEREQKKRGKRCRTSTSTNQKRTQIIRKRKADWSEGRFTIDSQGKTESTSKLRKDEIQSKIKKKGEPFLSFLQFETKTSRIHRKKGAKQKKFLREKRREEKRKRKECFAYLDK